MKQWKELSADTLSVMAELGNFGPTTNVSNREVKGYVDGKVYYSSADLRRVAAACEEVAAWLDEMAMGSGVDPLTMSTANV